MISSINQLDRFRRTIKEKLERYRKLKGRKNIIQSVKDKVQGSHHSHHCMLDKSPNEITREEIAKKKRQRRGEILKFFIKYKIRGSKLSQGKIFLINIAK